MKPIIALDADGVLLDYHHAYALAWGKAFGVQPTLSDPQAYWAMDRWGVQRLDGEALLRFRAAFDQQIWSSIPPLAGAIDACLALEAAGYTLVCVSAIEAHFQAARLKNLRDCGFPIEKVIATSSATQGLSPKAGALAELKPVAFVDDFLPYLRGIPRDIHAALVLREANGSPNSGDDVVWAHSQHADLAGFATWWLRGAGDSRCVVEAGTDRPQ